MHGAAGGVRIILSLPYSDFPHSQIGVKKGENQFKEQIGLIMVEVIMLIRIHMKQN